MRDLRSTGLNYLSRTINEVHTLQGEAATPYVDAAKRLYHKEGAIEIDDNAVVSGSTDNGEYVLAWVWVSDNDIES